MAETTRRARTLYLASAAFVALVAGLDTLAWSLACRRLEDGVREAAAAAGWTLTGGTSRWAGWPIAAEVSLPDIVLHTGPDIVPPVTWSAPGVAVRLSAWNPTVLTGSANGAQTLAVGAGPPVPLTAQSLTALIDLTAHDPARITAVTLEVTAPTGNVRVATADLLLRPDGLSADLAGITLPGRAGQPITPPIDALRFDGRVTPPIEPQTTPAGSARRWRDKNGQIDLDLATLRWGPLEADGRARLTLDENLQPNVVGRITATGLASVIGQLAQTGAITQSSATAAQAMLAILSAPSAGGTVTLPLALHDSVVSVAGIPLLRLAPLQWD